MEGQLCCGDALTAGSPGDISQPEAARGNRPKLRGLATCDSWARCRWPANKPSTSHSENSSLVFGPGIVGVSNQISLTVEKPVALKEENFHRQQLKLSPRWSNLSQSSDDHHNHHWKWNGQWKRGNWCCAIKVEAVNYRWLLLAFTTSSCYPSQTMPAVITLHPFHFITPTPKPQAPPPAFLPRLPLPPSFVPNPGLDTRWSRCGRRATQP